MTYSGIRSAVTSAKSSSTEEAITKLADAIIALTKTIEQDLRDLEIKINVRSRR